jgi:hypothetical protein
MGFSVSQASAMSRAPGSTAANRATAPGSGVQALTARAAAGYNLTTDWSLVAEDPTGLATFGVGKYGKSFFAGMNADATSAATEFWQQADSFPRLTLGYSVFGAGVSMGPGSAAADTSLSRMAPVGQAATGSMAVGGRRLERQGFFNVMDYGATGNGTTDDRPAIQAAIDAAASAGRGTVFFPCGTYAVGASLILPNDKAIRLQGAGHFLGGTGNLPGVRITPAGFTTADVIKNDQTTLNGGNDRWSGAIDNIELHNGSATTRICLFSSTNQALWQNMSFRGDSVGDNGGTEFRGIWNSTFLNCRWTWAGGASSPATFVADDSFAGGNTNTVHWDCCEWEVNRGTDIYMDAGTTITVACSFTNCKLESALAHEFPFIVLNNCRQISFVGGYIHTASPDINALITSSSLASRNQFVGVSMQRGNVPSGTRYLISQTGGSLQCVGCGFSNFGTGVTAWQIGASVASPSGTFNTSNWNPGGAVGAGNYYFDYTAAKRFADARAGSPGPQMNV